MSNVQSPAGITIPALALEAAATKAEAKVNCSHAVESANIFPQPKNSRYFAVNFRLQTA